MNLGEMEGASQGS